MPEGATTLTAHLHHHLSFAQLLRLPRTWIITWLLKQAKLHTALRKPSKSSPVGRVTSSSPLTAEGSATRWRAFRSRPKTTILLEFRSDPHSHRSLLKPKESRARIAFFGSTKGEQNRIWQWFFGSITDSRPRRLASTPVDLSCFHPPVRR